MKKILCITSLMVFLGMVMAMNASAALTIYLDQGNAALDLPATPAPYATVEITRIDEDSASVKFTALTTSGVTYHLFDSSAANLNVNSSAFLVVGGTSGFTFTGGASGTAVTSILYGSPSSVSEFGNFNLQINMFDGPTRGADSLAFELYSPGSNWLTDADVLISGGYLAAAHIYPPGGTETGFAAGVPIPGAVYLFGSGLAGLVGIARWRRRK